MNVICSLESVFTGANPFLYKDDRSDICMETCCQSGALKKPPGLYRVTCCSIQQHHSGGPLIPGLRHSTFLQKASQMPGRLFAERFLQNQTSEFSGWEISLVNEAFVAGILCSEALTALWVYIELRLTNYSHSSAAIFGRRPIANSKGAMTSTYMVRRLDVIL